MLRRLLPVLLIGLLAAVSCGPGASGKVVLRVANWGGAGDDDEYAHLQQDIYREFERRNPGVEVRIEGIPDSYNQKIILSHIANASPDVMMLDASYAALHIENGIVEDLQPFADHDPSAPLGAFFPNVLGIGRRGKALYAIPQDFTPMVVYYNKDLFDRAHEPYPDGSWNFDQFREVCHRLTAPGQYGLAFSNWMPGWVMFLWNNGGDVVSPDGSRATGTLDSDPNAATFAFFAKLIQDGYAPSLSAAAATGVDLFANGQAAMTVSGHWSLIGYKSAPKDAKTGKPKIDWRRLGVCPVPHNGPTSLTVMYESGYAIARRAKHKDLAWKFIKYMTSHEVQARYQSSGIAVCGRQDVANERAKDPLEAQFLPIVPSARPPYGARIENYDFVERQGQDALSRVLQSGTPPMDALRIAASRIDKEFAKK